MKKGWRGESQRHRMSAKGIKSGVKKTFKPKVYRKNKITIDERVEVDEKGNAVQKFIINTPNADDYEKDMMIDALKEEGYSSAKKTKEGIEITGEMKW
jgi:hypothetical protein